MPAGHAHPGDPKPRPNRARYIEALRAMTPEARLLKAFELGELARSFQLAGLRLRNPGLDDRSLRRLAAAQLIQWRRSNS